MSAHPEAFEFLRHRAYRFVQKHGKDRQKLHDFCTASLQEQETSSGSIRDLSNSDKRALCKAVTDWVMTKYNPPRRKAERSRQERAAAVALAPYYMECAEQELGTKPTIREAAKFSDQSKSTLARNLLQNGVSPRREKRIETLPTKQKRLVRILDATFPRDGLGLLRLDNLSYALWDDLILAPGDREPEIAKSTKSTRRKRLKQYVREVQDCGLGFNFLVQGEIVAVRRGRKLKPSKDTLILIDDEQRLNGTIGVRLPQSVGEGFWDDIWVQRLLATYQLAGNPFIFDPSALEPLLQLMHLTGKMLLDPTPIYRCAQAAIDTPTITNELPSLMMKFSENIEDKETARAVNRVGLFLTNAHSLNGTAVVPSHVFDDLENLLGFSKPLKERHPLSYGRFMYLKHELATDMESTEDLIERCTQLANMERSGTWAPPPDTELSLFLEMD